MRIAILADLCANETALLAVLEHLKQFKVERIWVIGRLLGFGPDPVAVVDLVRALVEPERCLLGYLDGRVLSPAAPDTLNPFTKNAVQWTRQQLHPHWWSRSTTKQRWAWLNNRASHGVDNEWQFFSGTPADPRDGFLRDFSQDGHASTFAAINRGAFIGHRGQPGIVFTDTGEWSKVTEIGSPHPLQGRKFIACPGAVGQPRDGNPHAAYAIFDGETITWHRVAYDVDETIRRIQAQPELPEQQAERLAAGR